MGASSPLYLRNVLGYVFVNKRRNHLAVFCLLLIHHRDQFLHKASSKWYKIKLLTGVCSCGRCAHRSLNIFILFSETFVCRMSNRSVNRNQIGKFVRIEIRIDRAVRTLWFRWSHFVGSFNLRFQCIKCYKNGHCYYIQAMICVAVFN